MTYFNYFFFHSLKTYLLLHFSTDFNKQGLKWKKKVISKFCRARFLNFDLVFLKLDFEIFWKLCYLIIHVKKSQKTYLLLHFSTDFDKQGLEWKVIPVSIIPRAEIINFDFVFQKLDFEIFWKLHYLIITVKNSQKTYLLLHFSTDFDKQGLKWKKMSISKITRARILNFDFVFQKLDFEILKIMLFNNFC